jgi:hypothetical protein
MAKRQPPAHAWVKGQSGNPGGRAKGYGDLRELCREHTREAIERIIAAMRNDDDAIAVRASEALLDRGWGKPSSSVDVTSGGGPLQSRVEVVFVEPDDTDKPG